MKPLLIDFETRSRVDLRKTGAWRYAEDASTDVLCAAFTTPDGGKFLWIPDWLAEYRECHTYESSDWKYEVVADEHCAHLWNHWVEKEECMVEAHNAEFELAIVKMLCAPRYGWAVPSYSQLIDTMAQCAAVALPQSLGAAGEALGLPIQKSTEGRKLMLKMCKPRKPSLKNPSEWHLDAESLRGLCIYCIGDVESEAGVAEALPPLSTDEREVWEAHIQMNAEGVYTDRNLVEGALILLRAAQEKAMADVTKRTNKRFDGRDVNRRNAALEYLRGHGCEMEGYTKAHVSEALARPELTDDCRAILEGRQQLGMTSSAKYEAYANQTCADGYIRGTLNYHGAATGRWAGRGIQPQNLPARVGFDSKRIPEAIAATNSWNFKTLCEISNDQPIQALSSLLRPALIASPSTTFLCGDYKAIEARVLLWLAMDPGLLIFRQGGDIYKDMAAAIYNIPVEEVTAAQRQLGKTVILGLGYGMGHVKFGETCEAQGIDLSGMDPESVVQIYREKYRSVRTYWYDIERAAIEAVAVPGSSQKCGSIAYRVNGRALQCRLPSGRKLNYRYPRLVPSDRGDREQLVYMGVGLSRKFSEQRTYSGRLVENIVQAGARDMLATAICNVVREGYRPVLTVHDEVLVETSQKPLDELQQEMNNVFVPAMVNLPMWANGCPLEVDGWFGQRYRK